MNRFAFLTAAVLTAFVLVMTGGIVSRLASAAAPTAPPVAAQPAVSSAADAREAEWRQLLAQANERLMQAQAAPPAAPAIQADPAQSAYISPDEAAQAALAAVPGARLLRQPELVAFQGATAYEVTLDQGLVYVDAATRQILYNGPQQAQIAAAQSQPRPHESGDDHEGSEHNDD